MKPMLAVLLTVFVILQPVQAADDEKAQFEAVLKKIMPNAEVDSVRPAPVAGFYETVIGSEVLYISKDGRYIFQGNLFDMQQRANLTEETREGIRLDVVNNLDPDSMIVFAPETGKTKYTITAFTDVDCSYCRKMHSQIQTYNDLGIAIRYLAFPRTGPDTPSYYKAVSVWCADDRQAMMTRAKNGRDPEQATCDNPVDEHLAAAEKVGVTGTPTLVLEDGKVLPGYVPPERLLQILEEQANRS